MSTVWTKNKAQEVEAVDEPLSQIALNWILSKSFPSMHVADADRE